MKTKKRMEIKGNISGSQGPISWGRGGTPSNIAYISGATTAINFGRGGSKKEYIEEK
jgi:hypothetical protein